MIQRIQTLYLLFAMVLMGLWFFFPLMSFGTTEGVSHFYVMEVVDANGVATTTPWYLMLLTILVTALPFGTIFRYKHRLQQIRYCVVELVLLAGTILMTGFYCYRLYTLFEESSPALFAPSFKVTLLFPLLAMLFVWLAMRGIFRDEMMVRAADRIR